MCEEHVSLTLPTSTPLRFARRRSLSLPIPVMLLRRLRLLASRGQVEAGVGQGGYSRSPEPVAGDCSQAALAWDAVQLFPRGCSHARADSVEHASRHTRCRGWLGVSSQAGRQQLLPGSSAGRPIRAVAAAARQYASEPCYALLESAGEELTFQQRQAAAQFYRYVLCWVYWVA